jgi:hypothetical protein
MDAVHLDDEPGGLPHRVKPPAAAARVLALRLPIRLRQPVLAKQPGQVELGKRLRASRDVVERVLDHGPPRQPLVPRHHRRQILDPDQPLLHARGEYGLRAPVGRHPGRRIHQRPCRPCPRRHPQRMNVVRS